MNFPSSPFTNDITALDIASTMQQRKGWEDKYRQVVQWGKQLPSMPDELKCDQVTISGCESQVWLLSEQQGEKWYFCADSDARIVRGLIAIVMAAFDGQTAAEITAFDVEAYFSELGLIQHLSPSRGNGLKAIVTAVKEQVIESPASSLRTSCE